MRRLPKYIRIMGQKVSVQGTKGLTVPVTDAAGDEHDHNAYGVYLPGYPGIVLDTDFGPERVKVTLVHEVVHAILNAGRLDMGEDEEEFVGRVSPLILDFIRSNRGAIAYLQES